MNFKAYAILLALGTATNTLLAAAATPGAAKAASSLGFQLGAAPRQGKRIKYKKGFLRRLQGKEPDYCDETKKPKFQAKGSPTKGECMETVKGQTYLPQDFKNTNGEPSDALVRSLLFGAHAKRLSDGSCGDLASGQNDF